MSIIILNHDPLLGADSDGNLYDGVKVRLGTDELTVDTTVSDDGQSFDRVTRYGDHIISKSTVTFEGFSDSSRPKAVAMCRTAAQQDGELPEDWEADPAEVESCLQTLWETEKQITSHGKTYVDAYVDGELQSVEKKMSFIDWTER